MCTVCKQFFACIICKFVDCVVNSRGRCSDVFISVWSVRTVIVPILVSLCGQLDDICIYEGLCCDSYNVVLHSFPRIFCGVCFYRDMQFCRLGLIPETTHSCGVEELCSFVLSSLLDSWCLIFVFFEHFWDQPFDDCVHVSMEVKDGSLFVLCQCESTRPAFYKMMFVISRDAMFKEYSDSELPLFGIWCVRNI